MSYNSMCKKTYLSLWHSSTAFWRHHKNPSYESNTDRRKPKDDDISTRNKKKIEKGWWQKKSVGWGTDMKVASGTVASNQLSDFDLSPPLLLCATLEKHSVRSRRCAGGGGEAERGELSNQTNRSWTSTFQLFTAHNWPTARHRAGVTLKAF